MIVYIEEARYLESYKIWLRFNTGETGEVDLKELILSNPAAQPLRDETLFSRFYLDAWPTLAWDCGFDVAPESLYRRATGKSTGEDTGEQASVGL